MKLPIGCVWEQDIKSNYISTGNTDQREKAKNAAFHSWSDLINLDCEVFFLSFHTYLCKNTLLSLYVLNIPLFQSISSYHLLLSEDEILTKAEIHLCDVKYVKLCLFWYLHMQKHGYANITYYLWMHACTWDRKLA